jgi:hypothetical protein
MHFSTQISSFSCPWIRIPNTWYGSGYTKSLNPDPIRIHNPEKNHTKYTRTGT